MSGKGVSPVSGDDGREQEDESDATRPFVDFGNKRTLNWVTRPYVTDAD